MKRILTVAVFMVVALSSYSQGFRIYNDLRSVEISPLDLVQINIGEPVSDKNCCSIQKFFGTIESVSKDSILFKADAMQLILRFSSEADRFDTGNNFKMENSVAKSDILGLINYKSHKKRKLKKSLSVTGGLLMVGGLATTLSSILVSSKSDKQKLILAGGIQFGTGLVIGISSRSKKYNFKTGITPWRFE